MPQFYDKMRQKIFSDNQFIICSTCKHMMPSTNFYVMFKMGDAFEKLFDKEIQSNIHFASCDECCGNRFTKRINEYLKDENPKMNNN